MSAKQEVVERLRSSVAAGRICDQADLALAQEYLEHLRSRIRVSVMGPHCDMAIAVSNFLVGRQLLPDAAAGRLIHLEQGCTFEAVAYLRNGETKTYCEHGFEDGFEKDAQLMQITSELPTLAPAVINCATAGTMKRLRGLTSLVGPFTDMALWVPSELCTEELDIWKSLPDRVRSRGYLVLTPAHDDPALLYNRAKGHFAGAIVIDPSAALENCGGGNGVVEELLHQTGSSDLLNTIEREKERLDQVIIVETELLLNRLPSPVNSGKAEPKRLRIHSAPVLEVSGHAVGRVQSRSQAIADSRPATPWSLGL